MHAIRAILGKPGFSVAIILYLLSLLHFLPVSTVEQSCPQEAKEMSQFITGPLLPSSQPHSLASALQIRKEGLGVPANQITTPE